MSIELLIKIHFEWICHKQINKKVVEIEVNKVIYIYYNLNFNFQDRSRIFYKFEEVRLGHISNKHELLFESSVKF